MTVHVPIYIYCIVLHWLMGSVLHVRQYTVEYTALAYKKSTGWAYRILYILQRVLLPIIRVLHGPMRRVLFGPIK